MEYFTFKNYDWYCKKMDIKKSLYTSLKRFSDFCFNLDVYFGGSL